MDLAALLARHKDDFLDQRAQFLGSNPALVIILKGIGEPLCTPAINACNVRMQVRCIGRRFRLAGKEFRLLPFQLVHARLHRRLIHAVLNGRDNSCDSFFDLVQRPTVLLTLRPPFAAQVVHFLGEGAHGFLDGAGRNQPVFQPGQHTLLDLLARDGPAIVADAAPMMVQAAVAVPHDEAILAAAATAGQQAGKKGDWPLLLVELTILGFPDALGGRLEPHGDILLSRANRIPEFIIHDPQMRNLAPDPLLGWIDARHALAGRRVFDKTQAVPDQNARI